MYNRNIQDPFELALSEYKKLLKLLFNKEYSEEEIKENLNNINFEVHEEDVIEESEDYFNGF